MLKLVVALLVLASAGCSTFPVVKGCASTVASEAAQEVGPQLVIILANAEYSKIPELIAPLVAKYGYDFVACLVHDIGSKTSAARDGAQDARARNADRWLRETAGS